METCRARERVGCRRHHRVAANVASVRFATKHSVRAAIALLTGYGWLAVCGVLWLDIGRMSFTDLGRAAHGSAYDAMLHAVFLGFVISMIFAHAPVIVPSVLGRPLPFNRSFYLPLAMLHVTLLLRLVGGDAMHNEASWQWGGSLNEVALLLFVALAASTVVRAARSQRAARQVQLPTDGGVSAGSTTTT